MQLAHGASTYIATADKKKVTKDSLIVVLAYNQRRFYVFLHVDPKKDAKHAKNINGDIWNKAPTAQDHLLGSEGNAAARGAAQATAYIKAILWTTMGDIHIKFFLKVQKPWRISVDMLDWVITIMSFFTESYKPSSFRQEIHWEMEPMERVSGAANVKMSLSESI
jgi:hypothetical protein